MPIRWLRAAAPWVAVMPIALLGAACNSTAEQGSTFSSASSNGVATQGDGGQLEGGAGGPVEPSATPPAGEDLSGGAGGPAEPTLTAPPTKDPSGGAGGPPEPMPTTVDVNALCTAAAVSPTTTMPDGWPAPSAQDLLNNMASRLATELETLKQHELSVAFADYASSGVALLASYQSSDSAAIASARERVIASGRKASELARSLGFDECAALTQTG